jgi:hypothetical protein
MDRNVRQPIPWVQGRTSLHLDTRNRLPFVPCEILLYMLRKEQAMKMNRIEQEMLIVNAMCQGLVRPDDENAFSEYLESMDDIEYRAYANGGYKSVELTRRTEELYASIDTHSRTVTLRWKAGKEKVIPISSKITEKVDEYYEDRYNKL